MRQLTNRIVNVMLGFAAAVAAAGVLVASSIRGDVSMGRWAAVIAGGGLLVCVLLMVLRGIRRYRSPQRKVHRLINEGDVDGLRGLLDEYPDLSEATDEHGGTALHRAALQGRLQAVRLLLRRGADANARETMFGFTPLHLASCRTYRPVVAALHPELDRCDFGEDEAREAAVAEALLDGGAEFDVRAGFSRTALHMAAVAGRAELTDVLLQSGASVGVSDDLGFTALHYAAFGGDGRVATLLLSAGADETARAEMDYTPLHTAAEKGATEVARVLMERGSDPNLTTRHGRTAMALAAQHGHEALVKLIRENGGKQDVEGAVHPGGQGESEEVT